MNDSEDYLGENDKVRKRHFAMIEGRHEKICTLLIEKTLKRKIYFIENDIVIFENFNGANYLEISEVKVDLVSFSSILVNVQLLTLSHYSTTRNSSILIHI